jgi:hypothetical protein
VIPHPQEIHKSWKYFPKGGLMQNLRDGNGLECINEKMGKYGSKFIINIDISMHTDP